MLPYARLLICTLSLGLATTTLAAPPKAENAMPDRAALEAALDECVASLNADSSGRPDHSAMDSCMSAKGFTRPAGPPGHGPGDGAHGNPPPDR